MNIIYNVVMILCFLFSMYFVITGLFTFKKRKKKLISNKEHKFAILIPCRNEEQVIKSLIESITDINTIIIVSLMLVVAYTVSKFVGKKVDLE